MTNVVEFDTVAAYDRKKAEAEAKEKALKLFKPNDAPYNLEAAAREVELGLFEGFAGFFRSGCALVLIKEHEPRRTYAALLENRFRLPARAARFWEQFARLCVRNPKFREVFNKPGMVHKGINLLAGLSEPEVEAELARFEETGELLGLDEVALHTKTNRELKAENRRLRREKQTAGQQAKQECDRLKKKVEALEAEAGVTGLKESLVFLAQGEEQITEGMATLAKADCELLAKDAGAVARARLLIDKMRRVADFIEGSFFSAAKARMEAQG